MGCCCKAISLIYYYSYLVVLWGLITDWLYFIYSKMIFLMLKISQEFTYRAMIIPLRRMLFCVQSLIHSSESQDLPMRKIRKDGPGGSAHMPGGKLP
jgi:hypothetical protein